MLQAAKKMQEKNLVMKAENELEKTDDEYEEDEHLFELSVSDPVVKSSLKQKTGTTPNLDQYKRRLELRGGIETWVPIEKQKSLGTTFRSKTSRLRSGLVFAVMRVLTPNFRKAILDWRTRTDRTPRPFTLFLKKRFGERSLCGAEIGFGYGHNALSLLEELNIVRLFCVDPLEPYTNKFGDTIAYFTDLGKGLYSRISKDPRVCFVKLPSDKAFASKRLPPGDLDFVYVDGLHTVDQAYRDIMNALDFVKIGGVVGGHDFTQDHEDSVLPAVFKVSAETGLIPTVEMPDFWFVKNADFSE